MTDSAPGMAITWVGHATVLLEVDGVRLLTDPVLGGRIGPLTRIATAPDPDGPSELDAVLVSHLHADHTDLRSLRRVAGHSPVIVPAGAGDWLRRKGLAHVQELRAGADTQIGTLRVSATPALHEGRRWPYGPTAESVGYLVTGSTAAYFAGDTDLFQGLDSLHGAADVALLPVSGWGRTLPPGHLDPERAARAAALIEPRIAIPIHWGTFALPRPLRLPGDADAPAREFAARCRDVAPEVEVRVLAPGETTVVS